MRGMRTMQRSEGATVSTPNVLILGAARHGKDTAAEILAGVTGWSFYSSSMFVAQKAVYPVLLAKYGYASLEDCYNDRVNHREEWRDLIRAYNQNDRARLAKELLDVCNIYVGMRCHMEYEACVRQNVFDHVIWVEASNRVKRPDPSLTIKKDDTMCVLDNNGSIDVLRESIKQWVAANAR